MVQGPVARLDREVEVELSLHAQVLGGAFAIALVFGAAVWRTHFCTLGAVSDWINIGDTRRLRAWFLAVAVAMLGLVVLEFLGLTELDQTRPPYRTPRFAWARYLLGGVLFGVGMTLASGCTSKTLARLGGGNLKSLVVLAMVALGAWLMIRTDLYALAFDSWLAPLTLDLSHFGLPRQDLGTLLATPLGLAIPAIRAVAGVIVAGLILYMVLRSRAFRASGELVLGGVLVGLCVVAGWWLTGGSLGREWIAESQWLDAIPQGVAVQSLTFVNAMSDALVLVGGGGYLLLTFGVVTITGVALGAFIYALASRGLRLEWFTSWADLLRHLTGGFLMGVGGVLAMGCTIGQGISGASTLALGSFLALGGIILGSVATMKVEYYKLLYEDASLLDILLSVGADLRLLPRSLRRLDAP